MKSYLKKLKKILFVISLCTSTTVLSAQQVTNKPSQLIYRFGVEVNYYRNLYSGIRAISYGYMQRAFPNDSYTDLLAKIEQLPNNQYIQDRFFYVVFRNNGSDDFKRMLNLLSKDATASVAISKYYLNRFKAPLGSIKDLKIRFDKAFRDQAKSKNSQDLQSVPSSGKVDDSSLDKINELKGTKQFLNVSDLLEFVSRDNFSVEDVKTFMVARSSRKWIVEGNSQGMTIKCDLNPDEMISYDPSTHEVTIETSY